ncbi:MAG: MFS transporter [Negativicutes bacterium]|nr:MFS transporter [Negativicutes bacterium]
MESTKSYRVGVVALLFAGTFINAVDRASLSVAAPLIIKEFQLDTASMGIALSAFFWLYAMLNAPIGALSDRLPTKSVLGWAVALWSLASAATGLVRNLPQLIACRLMVGVGESASFPVSTKIIVENFPVTERASALTIYTSGVRLGNAATPLIMTYLIVNWDWRTAFFVTGVGSLLWCIVWYFTFTDRAAAQRGPVKEKIRVPWKAFLTNRATLGIILTKFFQDYLLYLFLTWVPAYLVLERGFSIVKMGVFASLPWIAGTIAQALSGILSDWLIKKGVSVNASRKGVQVGLQCMAATVIGVGFIDDPMWAVGLLTFAVAGESAAGGLIWAIMAEAAPPRLSGTLGGVMNSCGALAGILSPIMTGVLVKVTGSFQLALIVGGCMILISALSVLFIIPELKPMVLEGLPEADAEAKG